MTFLFWNINKKPLLGLISAVVRERGVDVLMLAENPTSDVDLMTALNGQPGEPVFTPAPHYPQMPGLRIMTTLSMDAIDLFRDAERFSIIQLRPPIGQSLLLMLVHLHSKLRLQTEEQAMLAPRWREEIDAAEQAHGHARTIVVGDFNMNPFEIGVAGSEGFHAVMKANIARAVRRNVKGLQRRYFFNPMWGFFGDGETPGTYYDDGSRPMSFFWNMFDQVLLRPALIPKLSATGVEIVTKIGNTSLLTPRTRRPNKQTASDHLPIVFTLTN